jgi:TPR repeat protein
MPPTIWRCSISRANCFPQDFNRAAELLRVAAQAGSPEAQYALGTFYKEGRGVPKDMGIEAVRLWALAALADNVDAQVEYAIALYNGDGIEERTSRRGDVPQSGATAAPSRRTASRAFSPTAAARRPIRSRRPSGI